MKQYLTPEQTAKLIELGLPKPKMAAPALKWVDGEPTFEPQYTIGELIEILPRCIEGGSGSDEAVLEISYDSQDFVWFCGHRWMYNRGWRFFNGDYRTCDNNELIDALYRYVVALKEEGVI